MPVNRRWIQVTILRALKKITNCLYRYIAKKKKKKSCQLNIRKKKLQALRVGYCLSGSHIDSRDLYKKKVRFFLLAYVMRI